MARGKGWSASPCRHAAADAGERSAPNLL